MIWRCLGGRFASVAPSDLWRRGAFAFSGPAAQGVPVPMVSSGQAVYADSVARSQLQTLGKQYGCHSCGITRAWRWDTFFKRGAGAGRWGIYKTFHADHQPPVKFARPGEAQRFFPQCPTCSTLQAASCRTDVRVLLVHTAMRRWHIWWPWPLLATLGRPVVDRFVSLDRDEDWSPWALTLAAWLGMPR